MACLRGQTTLANLEELAEVRVVLVGGNLGERLLALLGRREIEVPAVTAGMKIRAAIRAGVAPADLIADDIECPTASRATSHDTSISEKLA